MVDEGDRIAHLLDEPVQPGRVARRESTGPAASITCSSTPASISSRPCSPSCSATATISVHFGRESSTLDLDTPDARAPAQVVEAERRANRIVTENRPVEVSFEDAASAAGLRKASDREGTLRIVTIRGLDRSACGGTHVRATGEIGPILIRKVGAGAARRVRLEFLCGERAVRRARADADLLAALAAPQSAAPEELPALLEAQRAELNGRRELRRELEEALAGYRARELYQTSARGPGSARVVIVQEDAGPPDRLRPLALAVAGLPQGVLLGATAGTGRSHPGVVGGLGRGCRAAGQGGAGAGSADAAAAMRGWHRGACLRAEALDRRWPRSGRRWSARA